MTNVIAFRLGSSDVCSQGAMAAPRMGTRVTLLPSRIWRAWGRRRRLARDAAELARMDDRLLRDIGLTRFDVAAGARIWTTPTYSDPSGRPFDREYPANERAIVQSPRLE